MKGFISHSNIADLRFTDLNKYGSEGTWIGLKWYVHIRYMWTVFTRFLPFSLAPHLCLKLASVERTGMGPATKGAGVTLSSPGTMRWMTGAMDGDL